MDDMEWVARYLAKRDLVHAEQIQQTLGEMTERERRLVCEVAVMGYVQGVHAQQREIPPDSHVVTLVVGSCLAMSDLYPVINSLTETDRA